MKRFVLTVNETQRDWIGSLIKKAIRNPRGSLHPDAVADLEGILVLVENAEEIDEVGS